MTLSHPVTCEQIGERELYLGDARAAQPGTTEPDFTHVITLNSVEQPVTTAFHPLSDGYGVEYENFAAAVETAVTCHEGDGVVLVHCNVGISRSAAVIAAVLAITEDMLFESAVEEVKQYRDRASPRKPLCDAAQKYVS